MKLVHLLYARKDIGGGSTSFAVHLKLAFERAKIPVMLIRIGTKSKPAFHPYLGEHYFWTCDDLRDLVKRDGSRILLVASERKKNLPEPGILEDLLNLGMSIVVHDPNEFGIFECVQSLQNSFLSDNTNKIFCIRPTMKEFFPKAICIPHPYVEVPVKWPKQRKPACSLARVTFVKRTEIILEADRKLSQENKVKLFGAENRLYAHHKLKKLFPDYQLGNTGLPFEWGASVNAAKDYWLSIDMTYFPNDGGGSQYSFMESWNAGSVVVVHKDWLRYHGEMKDEINCIAVSSASELKDLIEATANDVTFQEHLKNIADHSLEHLRRIHDPVLVAKRYYKELVK